MRVRSTEVVGQLIREERKRQGLTQAHLAERVGVGRQWIHQIERGKDTAEVGLVLKTLHALGLRVSVERDAMRAPGDPRPLSRADRLARKRRRREEAIQDLREP
jgi:y4mF family transcriptional regulator